MAELALILWCVYGGGALGARVAIQLRRTGRTGLLGVNAPRGSLRWMAEVGHELALAMGFAAPILDLTGALEPIAALDETGVHVAGIALFAIGLTGVIVGQAQMGDAWRVGTDPDERTELVTGGLYGLVRNPIYTSLMPTLLGLALLVPNLIALASVPLFAAALEVETRLIEEPHLQRRHGAAYAAYAARVGRFLPGIGVLHRDRR